MFPTKMIPRYLLLWAISVYIKKMFKNIGVRGGKRAMFIQIRRLFERAAQQIFTKFYQWHSAFSLGQWHFERKLQSEIKIWQTWGFWKYIWGFCFFAIRLFALAVIPDHISHQVDIRVSFAQGQMSFREFFRTNFLVRVNGRLTSLGALGRVSLPGPCVFTTLNELRSDKRRGARRAYLLPHRNF